VRVQRKGALFERGNDRRAIIALMVTLAVLRQPRRARRLAIALWITWAVIVWNVVFDHVIVVAGRAFIAAAGLAAQGAGPYAHMDDWMRPAVTRAFWTATAASSSLLVLLLVILCPLRRIR
jgi:hypothetical protein